MKNNIIINNSGGEDFGGGGIWTLAMGATIIENNVIAYNSVTGTGGKGGGILIWSTSIKAKNNIIWGNTQTSGGQIALTGGGSAEIAYSDVEGGFSGMGNIEQDPLFGEMYLVDLSSPCIDAGDPEAAYNDPENPVNPGFALFPAMGTTRNDMGAYGGPMSKILPAVLTSIKERKSGSLPGEFHLYQNYPNPFNPETTIRYAIPSRSYVSLEVYNLLGKMVAVLVDGEQQEGVHSTTFSSEDFKLSSGVYFYRLESGIYSSTRKLLVVK